MVDQETQAHDGAEQEEHTLVMTDQETQANDDGERDEQPLVVINQHTRAQAQQATPDLNRLTVLALKNELRTRGLRSSGPKAELVARLRAALTPRR